MKNIKKYLSKKEYILFTISLMVVIISSFSYAFYYNVDMSSENVVVTDCFNLTFQDQNDINLEGAYPLTEQEGSNLKPYTFTITNVCNSIEEYQVNIETLNESTIKNNDLRYKLDDTSSDLLRNQDEVLTYVNNGIKERRKITTVTLYKNESVIVI